MDRRTFVQSTGAAIGAVATRGLPVVGITGAALLTTACDKEDVVFWGGQVVSYFERTLPIFKEFLPGNVNLIEKGLQIAKDVKKALESNAANTIDLLRELIAPDGLFNQLAKTIGLITDDAQRKIASGILALAGISLDLIAAYLDRASQQTTAGRAAAAKINTESARAVRRTARSNKLELVLASVKF